MQISNCEEERTGVICSSDETAHISHSAYFSDGGNPNEGFILSLNKAKKFGYIWVQNDDDWTLTEADVVCRSAGFHSSLHAFKMNSQYSGYNWQIAFTHVNCNGTEQYLGQCEHDIVYSYYDYYETENAAAICALNESDINSSEIRLFDIGEQLNYGGLGMILMKTEGRNWSLVCDDDFTMEEANVACRQLGYLGANDLLKGYGYDGKDFSNLANAPYVTVVCNSGNQNNVQECQWEEIGDLCKSQTAAGLSCSSK